MQQRAQAGAKTPVGGTRLRERRVQRVQGTTEETWSPLVLSLHFGSAKSHGQDDWGRKQQIVQGPSI